MPPLKQILNFVKFFFQDPTSLIKVLISLVFTGNVVCLNQWPPQFRPRFSLNLTLSISHAGCIFVTCMCRASSIFLLFTDVCSGLRRLPVTQVSIAEQLEVPKLGLIWFSMEIKSTIDAQRVFVISSCLDNFLLTLRFLYIIPIL